MPISHNPSYGSSGECSFAVFLWLPMYSYRIFLWLPRLPTPPSYGSSGKYSYKVFLWLPPPSYWSSGAYGCQSIAIEHANGTKELPPSEVTDPVDGIPITYSYGCPGIPIEYSYGTKGLPPTPSYGSSGRYSYRIFLWLPKYWNSVIFMTFLISRMKLYDFLFFNDSHVEFYDFHEFRDAHMEF